MSNKIHIKHGSYHIKSNVIFLQTSISHLELSGRKATKEQRKGQK